MKVLHVTESYGGGTASALDEYVLSTPEISHHLLCSIRADSSSPMRAHFDSTTELPRSWVAAVKRIRRSVESGDYDVVHLHSSYAGLFGRMSFRNRRTSRIVYTPHCFAFERRDLSRAKRAAVWLAEYVLAWNTEVICGCSPREVSLARGFHTRRDPVYAPNVVHPPAVSPDSNPGDANLIGIGRLADQKDPLTFAGVVSRLREMGVDVRAVWAGDGDEGLRAALADEGVHVTGWLSREEVLTLLAGARVYLHTARWEGFPMTILEATSLHVPAVVRDVPSLRYLPPHLRHPDVATLANACAAVLSSDGARQALLSRWHGAVEQNTVLVQQAALRRVYAATGE